MGPPTHGAEGVGGRCATCVSFMPVTGQRDVCDSVRAWDRGRSNEFRFHWTYLYSLAYRVPVYLLLPLLLLSSFSLHVGPTSTL